MTRRWFTAALAAIATVTLTTAVGPVEAVPTLNDPAGLSQFAETNNCVVAAKLTITFDDGSTRKDVPTCVRQSKGEAMVGAAGRQTIPPSVRAVTPLGTKTFSSGAPYFLGSDVNGQLTAQYTNNAGLPVAFGYKVAPYPVSIATTYPTVRFDRTPPNCSYSKPGIEPINYWFHWSCRGHSYQTTYQIYGTLAFRVNVNGATGSALLEVAFNYKIVSI